MLHIRSAIQVDHDPVGLYLEIRDLDTIARIGTDAFLIKTFAQLL